MTPAKKRTSESRTPFEWAVLGVSAASIVTILIMLIASGLGVSKGPADLRVSVERAGERSGGIAYTVTVRNDGGETAENVEVEVSVGEETRSLNLTAVARDDEEAGVVVFGPGAGGPATAEIVSYSEPAR